MTAAVRDPAADTGVDAVRSGAARSDAAAATRERLIPLAVAVLLFAYLFTAAYLHARSFMGSFDLGYFDQAAWLIAHGDSPFVTVRGLHLLGDHTSPIFFPMAWVAGHDATTTVLLAIQAAGLSSAVVPLWYLSRRHAGLAVGPSALALGLYAAYPAVHNINLFDFHPEAVAVPALVGSVYFALERRWIPYSACLAVALACREDMAIPVFFLGIVVAVSVSRRAGTSTAAAGVAWFLVATRIIQPHFAGAFVPAEFLSAYGSDLGAVVTTFVTHPARVLGDLLVMGNVKYALGMLVPVAFIPLLAPRWASPALPLVVLYLLSSRPAAHNVLHHYTVVPTAFLFAALPFGLAVAVAWMRRPRCGRAAVAGVTAGVVMASLGGFLVWARESPRRRPQDWITTDTADGSRVRAAALIPRDAAVSASASMWTILFRRQRLYQFPAPWYDYEPLRDPVAPADRRSEVGWIVLDAHDNPPWYRRAEATLPRVAQRRPLHLVFDENGIRVFRVGRPEASATGR